MIEVAMNVNFKLWLLVVISGLLSVGDEPNSEPQYTIMSGKRIDPASFPKNPWLECKSIPPSSTADESIPVVLQPKSTQWKPGVFETIQGPKCIYAFVVKLPSPPRCPRSVYSVLKLREPVLIVKSFEQIAFGDLACENLPQIFCEEAFKTQFYKGKELLSLVVTNPDDEFSVVYNLSLTNCKRTQLGENFYTLFYNPQPEQSGFLEPFLNCSKNPDEIQERLDQYTTGEKIKLTSIQEVNLYQWIQGFISVE